jgi:class 3 adenylate cyclase
MGPVVSFDGARTEAASGPIDVGTQNWVVVVEQDRSEANDGLGDLLRSMLVVMAVLVPITAVLAVLLARSLTRPFGTLVAAARHIASGGRSPDVARLGKNELGDVGRQLERVAARLDDEEANIAAEETQITDVLAAVVPPRLIDRVRRGERQIVDLLDAATVMSFLVDGIPEATGSAYDTVSELHDDLVHGIDRLVDEFQIERVRRSPTNALFVAGLGEASPRTVEAARFAISLIQMVTDVGDEYGHPLTIRAGLASGDVASGVIGEQQFSFSVWGEPVSTAFSLASLAQPGEILADARVHAGLNDEVSGEWEFLRRATLSGLDDDVEAWSITRPAPVTP